MNEESRKNIEALEPSVPHIYANLCTVAITPEEAILDFAQRDLENPATGKSIVRVYTNIPHAKRLAYAILNQIKHYEDNFGPVETEYINMLTPEARVRIEAEAKAKLDDANTTK